MPQHFLTKLVFGSLLVIMMGSATAIEITVPWARPTAPGAKIGGAFMTITGGQTADRLVAVSSPAAAVLELHTHLMDNGVAKMRAIPGIDVPAAGKVELKPGGLHIMLINLKAPLTAGDKIPLTLRFEQAGERTIDVSISAQPPESKGAVTSLSEHHSKHQH